MDSVKINFKYNNIHSCEAVVLSCIDFRFREETQKFVEEELGIKSFDLASVPGAAKAINDSTSGADIIWQCLGVPCNLHHAGKIVVVNHQDCGAYGGSEKFGDDSQTELEFHAAELKKAKVMILEKFSDREVILAYAKLSDDKNEVEFIRV